MSTTQVASAPEPVPAAPPASGLAALRLDRASITKLVGQVTEVSAGAVAVCYGLGMMVLAGQLRALGLHNTGILAGFKHDDILMKGFTAMVSHVPSVVTLVLLVAMVVKDDVRRFICDALSPKQGRSPAGLVWGTRRVVLTRLGIAAVCAFVLLTSTWWESTVVVVALMSYLLVAVRTRTLMTPRALLGTAAVGLLVIGVATTYLNAKPPPDVQIVTSDGRTEVGGLLGVGEDGEWYVVKYDRDARDGADDGQLQLIPDKQVVDIKLDEPPETGAPRLYTLLLGD
ncbi:hypothetical protein [Nocardioides lijunqiniae]|uniref:hypothetical protein n=1 Tax=Nocardioides lijunqiniae TaxID=2760832 RepID=UPI001878A0CF|nr:hypothetical protein [Nocardioides lijunqiniae]